MSRANTTELVGAVALVEETPKNIALPDKIWRFQWLNTQIEPLFFRHLLARPRIRARISALSSGSGGSMKNIAKQKLLAMPVPDIPHSEQLEFTHRIQALAPSRKDAEDAAVRAEQLFTSLQNRAFRGEL